MGDDLRPHRHKAHSTQGTGLVSQTEGPPHKLSCPPMQTAQSEMQANRPFYSQQ